jgi:hypothetical protein
MVMVPSSSIKHDLRRSSSVSADHGAALADSPTADLHGEDGRKLKSQSWFRPWLPRAMMCMGFLGLGQCDLHDFFCTLLI